MMKGLSWESLKQYPSLLPIYFATGAGVSMAALYLIRLAFKSPDVTWNHKSNPEPWQAYAKKHYFLYIPSKLRACKFPDPPTY